MKSRKTRSTLEFRRVNLALASPWTTARTRGLVECATVIVELIDDDGVIGRGEAAPAGRYAETPESVEALLRRVDPVRLFADGADEVRDYLETLGPGNMSAKCAVDVALLDIAAKRAGVPVYDHVGLGFREKQHVTSFTIGIDEPEVIGRKVAAAGARRVLKMKAGVPGDEANLRALRAVAPDKPLRVDVNEGWCDKELALERIEWLARDGHVEFVEQPMPAAAPVRDWAWLKERSPLPVFGDESYHHAGDAERAAECFHGVNVKLVKAGGLSGALTALRAARAAGLKTMLGCMIETSVLVSAAAHLSELCDFLDLDGNLLVTNDPYCGVEVDGSMLSFARAQERLGLRVSPRE